MTMVVHVGHHLGNLVHLHVGHHVGHRNVVSTLCEGSEALSEWKSESVTNLPTNGRTEVGTKDAGASKECSELNKLPPRS